MTHPLNRLQEAGAEAHTNTFYRQVNNVNLVSLLLFYQCQLFPLVYLVNLAIQDFLLFPRHYYFFMKEHKLMEVRRK